MTIELISQIEFDTLLKIYETHPILTFQNVGYQYIDKSKFTESDKEAFNDVEKILRASILGFNEFNNFKLTKNGEIGLRVQYDYSADDEGNSRPFTGVGYIKLNELKNGFNN